MYSSDAAIDTAYKSTKNEAMPLKGQFHYACEEPNVHVHAAVF
jgi:hypothetical protein